MWIAQLSDLHLRTPGRLFWDRIDTNARLARVFDFLALMRPRPELLLVTGDLTADDEPPAYAFLRAELERLAIRYLLLPGNHDSRVALRAAFPDQPWRSTEAGHLSYVVELGGARLVMLDSLVEGEAYGALGRGRRDWLETVLAAEGAPVILAMHHPPLPLGLPYMDRLRLEDGETLARLVARCRARLIAILCGHLHRPVVTSFAGVPLVAAPSTAFHCAPEMFEPVEEPAFLLDPPMFLLHQLTPEAELRSHLVVADSFPGPFRRR